MTARAIRRPGQKHAHLSTFPINTEEGMDRLYTVLSLLDGLPLQIDGSKRGFVNEAIARINRISAGVEQAYQPAPLAAPAEAAGPDPFPEEGELDMDNVEWGA